MASRNLGSLTIDLVARIAGFEAGMDKASRKAAQSSKQIEGAISKGFKGGLATVTAFAAGVVAGFVSVNAAIQGFNDAITRADKLDELSQRLGISAERLGEWGYAAQLSGSSLESVETGITRLSRALTAAEDPTSRQAKLFQALGVTAKDVESAIPQIADAFQRLNNQTQETAIAMELFGRGGAELLEFLNRGSAGINALGAEYQELGGISNETAADAAKFKDEMDRLRLAVGGVFTQIASGLLPAFTDLVIEFRDLVRNGDLAANTVSVLSAAFRAGISVVDGYNLAVAKTSAAIETIVNASAGFAEIQRNIGLGGAFDSGSIAAGAEKVRDAFREGDKALESIENRTNRMFRNVRGSVQGGAQQNDSALDDRLSRFLQTGGRDPKKNSGGKSDAERDAEALERAYKSLNDRLAESIALFGETGEAARIRYELENGALKALDDTRKQGLVTLAEQLDQMQLMDELEDAAQKRVKEETESFQRQAEQTAEYIDDLKFEIELLGMSSLEREKAIALRYAGVDAMSAEGQEISGLIEKFQEAAKEAELWMDVQNGISDALTDFVTGAKSAKEALSDFLNGLFDSATKAVMDEFAKSLVDMFKGAGGGGNQQGGGWGAFFSAIGGFFGGGKANGGTANPWMMYEVNERGFEMATVGGRDYMMTGSRPVEITPNHMLGGGVNFTQNNNYAAPQTNKTHTQLAAKTQTGLNNARRLTR